jgi:hypothetical protein
VDSEKRMSDQKLNYTDVLQTIEKWTKEEQLMLIRDSGLFD